MPRSFKSMFVELVSFLTLFALIGTMTSNFWERYLIQSELSNMKSSLHLLKETVHHIGAAYDNLHYELKGIVDMKEIKSTKSMTKDLPLSQHRSSDIYDAFSNMVGQEMMKIKENKSIGKSESEGHDKSIGIAAYNAIDKSIGSAELRGNDKSIGITPTKGNGKNVGILAPKETNINPRPPQTVNFNLKNATTATRNPLKSTGVNIDQQLDNKPTCGGQENNYSTNVHKCCKDHKCYEYKYHYKF